MRRLLLTTLLTFCLAFAGVFGGMVGMGPEAAGQGFRDMFEGVTENAEGGDLLPYQGIRETFRASGEDVPFELRAVELVLMGTQQLIVIISVLGVLFVVLAGFRMVTGGMNPDDAKNQSVIIRNIVGGIVLMNLANVFVSTVFFNPADLGYTTGADSEVASQIQAQNAQVDYLLGAFYLDCDLETTVANEGLNPVGSDPSCDFDPNSEAGQTAMAKLAPLYFANEVIFPTVQFFLGFLAAFAILYIIIAAFRILLARGEGDTVTEARRTILNGFIGLALILGSQTIVRVVFGTPYGQNTSSANVSELNPDVIGGVATLMAISNYIIGFFAVVTLIMYMYGGFLVFTAGVNEGNKKKGFSIMRWTTVGVLLAISSYAIVATLIRLGT